MGKISTKEAERLITARLEGEDVDDDILELVPSERIDSSGVQSLDGLEQKLAQAHIEIASRFTSEQVNSLLRAERRRWSHCPACGFKLTTSVDE